MASLLDWLGGQLEGAVAQINPWDNGADYNSVMNRRKREEQAQIQRAPRPQVQGRPQTQGQSLNPQQPQRRPMMANLASLNQNSVINRSRPGFDIGKAAGELFGGIGKGIADISKPVSEGGANVLADAGNWAVKNVVKPTVETVVKGANTVALPVELVGATIAGKNNDPTVQAHLEKVMKNSFITPEIASGKANPLEFGKQFTQAGVEAANVIPATKGVTTAIRGATPTLGLVKNAVVNNAKQAAVYGTANTSNDLLQGRGISPQSLVANFVAPAVLGTGSEITGALAGPAARAVADIPTRTKNLGLKPPTNLTPDELNAATKIRQARDGYISPQDITTQDALLYRDAEAKLGAQPGTPDGDMAVVDALNAHRDFDTRVAQRQQAATIALEKSNNIARRLVPGGTLDSPINPSRKDKILASKPAEYLFGDKKPVQDARIQKLLLERKKAIDAGQDERALAFDRVLKKLGYDEPVTKKISKVAKQNNEQSELQPQNTLNNQTNPESLNGSVQQLDQQTPLPGNKAPSGRTYANDTPNIDTEQYVKDMSKVQKDAQKANSSVGVKARDFKEKFIDDLAPIEDRLRKAIKQGAEVDPKDHITYQLDRSRRAEGIMNAYVRDNGLDKIIQNVDNTKEFDQYLIARHGKELSEDIATGRNATKDAALVKQLDGKYGEAAKQLYTYNQKLLDTSVKYGLISKEAADKLKKQYPEYVPFNRIFNEDELANLYGGSGKGDASISSQGVVKKIKGSNRAIASPLNSIIDKTRVVVEQGERNVAAKMLADYRKLPGNPFNLKEIPANQTIGNRSTISYLENGVKKTFETDKEIADAAKNMTRQEIGLWGRIASVPARVLRGGATTVNIGFAGANIVKDVVGAAINSRHPFRIANPQAFGKALAAALNHNGKYYQELMREGVAGTSFDMFRNPLKSNVGEIRSQKNIGTRALYNARPDRWFRTLENTIGRSEDFGRALQYYSNKKGFESKFGKGSKEAQILAADQARNNSTNFFRSGSYGKGINLAIPYWNAGVQGARIQGKRIAERPVQTLAKIGFVIAGPSAMIAMNNYSSEKNRQVMEEIPQYEKDGNIIIVGPDAKKNPETGRWEGVYKIPVPPQHIGLHKTIQDAVRAGVTGKEFSTAGNLGRIVEDYTTVNPTDPGAVANRYIPQGLKLIAEPMTNTNFFTGNKIVPDSQKNLPAKDQYNEYTSGTAKIAGQLTNISPRQIDNAIRTGMGGAGQNLVNILDNGLAATGVIAKKDIKGQNALDSITKRFYGAATINPSDKAEQTFGELKKRVTETDAYKNASSYDKSRMLNRLESDISAVAWHVSGKGGDDKLTQKQKSLLVDGFKADTYTNLEEKSGVTISDKIRKEYKDTLGKYNGMSSDDREKWFNTENDAEYRYEVAKYNNDKAEGKLSTAETIKAQKSLRKAKIGSKFTKNVRDLYSLSKSDLADFLSTDDPNVDKKKLGEELLAYDRALYDSGASSSLKFKYGFGSGSKTGRKGKGGKKGSGVTEGKRVVSLTQSVNKIRAPKTASAPQTGGGKTQMKRVPLKKYTVKNTTVGAAPKIRTSKAKA